MMEVLFTIEGRHYLLRQLPDGFYILAPGSEMRGDLPFRERKCGPIYRRPDEDEGEVFPFGTRMPLGFRFFEWDLPLHQFGSLDAAIFYPRIRWNNMNVFVRRWSSESADPHVLKADVCIDSAFNHGVIVGMRERGELPLNDERASHAAAMRLRESQLELLTAHGLRLVPDNYGPSSAWGDMRLADLELTEGPCPFTLPK